MAFQVVSGGYGKLYDVYVMEFHGVSGVFRGISRILEAFRAERISDAFQGT